MSAVSQLLSTHRGLFLAALCAGFLFAWLFLASRDEERRLGARFRRWGQALDRKVDPMAAKSQRSAAKKKRSKSAS